MKKFLKVLGIAILSFFVLLAVLLAAFWVSGNYSRAVPDDYTQKNVTTGALEAKYQAAGPYEVKRFKVKAGKPTRGMVFYYPAEMKDGVKYPVVSFVNGTGVQARRYPAVLKHLASWGFIVIGNQDPSTETGESAEATLAWLLEADRTKGSPFYGKVDTDNIGLTGYSRGGPGMFNAMSGQPHGGMYKTGVALSPTNETHSSEYGMGYDIAKVSVPMLMMAGDGDEFETEIVIPLPELEKMFGRLPQTPKVMARHKGSKHGETNYHCDGYLTAWFMHFLKADAEAGKAFFGPDAEILSTPLWSDVMVVE